MTAPAEHPDVEVFAVHTSSPDLHSKHFGSGLVDPALIVGQLSVVDEHAAGRHFESSGE